MKLVCFFVVLAISHFIFSQPKYTNPHSPYVIKSKTEKEKVTDALPNNCTIEGGNFHGIVHNHSSNYKNNLNSSNEDFMILDFQIFTSNQTSNYKFQFKQK